MSASRKARFLVSLLPGAALLVGALGVVVFISSRIQSGIGIAMGIVAAVCLALGLLLAYWILADWLNVKAIRTSRGASALRDGEVVAFDGVVRIEGDPLTAPFSGAPCAAYTYVVAASRSVAIRDGNRRVVIAQGFHMLPTRIEGSRGSLHLRSFPGFEDDLRENAPGTTWGDEARALVESISGRAPSASQAERESRLLELRHGEVEEVHHDYLMGRIGPHADGLAIDEEVLPVGKPVSVIGTYDEKRRALTARRSRLGPNLMVYRGNAEEVLVRVGKEVRGFAKAVAVLLLIGVVLLAIAATPASIRSKLPLLGSSAIGSRAVYAEARFRESSPILIERGMSL